METKEKRINVFGTYFSCLDINEGINLIKKNVSKVNYICFPSTDLISYAYKDSQLRTVYNDSFITFADGRLTELYAKFNGCKTVKNVSGYWLMEELLKTNLSHFFYGCDNQTLTKLKNNILKKHPDANIVGFKSPPLLTENEIPGNNQIVKDFKEINSVKPDLIWIGISSPKQDFLMYHYRKHLDRGIMLGVGAVFLYQAGVIKKGPEIMKKMALRWVWRLFQEPKKSFNRFFPGIVYFFFLVIKHDIFNMKSNSY